MKKIKKEKKDNSERWLLSYADFITLLMVFFIIMYSMSSVNAEKFQALADSMNAAMSGGGSGDGSGVGIGIASFSSLLPSTSPDSSQMGDQAEQDELDQTAQAIQQYLQEYNLQDSVKLRVDERGLVVILADTTTFESGSAEIISSFIPKLIQIADILSKVDNYVRIEGHTDNVPAAGGKFKSNWEVSTARATSLVQLFISQSSIAPEKLSAIGYGEYRPIAPNDTEDGRARNRRVEIVVIRSKFNSVEATSSSDASDGAGSGDAAGSGAVADASGGDLASEIASANAAIDNSAASAAPSAEAAPSGAR